jgi:hypothetical protein
VVLVLIAGFWLGSQRGSSGVSVVGELLSDPYKTAIREYLSDHNPGKIIELEWGPRRQFVGVRVRGEMWMNKYDSSVMHPNEQNPLQYHVEMIYKEVQVEARAGDDAYYDLSSQSPVVTGRYLGATESGTVDAFFNHPANEMEQKLLQRSWHQLYSWKEPENKNKSDIWLRNATWRASDPFVSITLKYKIETPTFGQSAARVIQFCFEPGSSKIFATQDVTPAEL